MRGCGETAIRRLGYSIMPFRGIRSVAVRRFASRRLQILGGSKNEPALPARSRHGLQTPGEQDSYDKQTDRESNPDAGRSGSEREADNKSGGNRYGPIAEDADNRRHPDIGQSSQAAGGCDLDAVSHLEYAGDDHQTAGELNHLGLIREQERDLMAES